MSKDALAGVYANMLEDEAFRAKVAAEPQVLETWDLTGEERQLLAEEADQDVTGFSIGGGSVMGYLGSGPRLSPAVASGLGAALNNAAGLPTGALRGPGFAAAAGCCPWGGGFASLGDISE